MKTIRTNKGITKLVKDYFDALVSSDATRAASLVSKSFTGELNERWMRQYLRMFNDVTEVVVTGVDRVDDNFAKVSVQTYNEIFEQEYSINVLRESEPYVLSKDGTWGVNPISLQLQ